jgi:hypothetical protein
MVQMLQVSDVKIIFRSIAKMFSSKTILKILKLISFLVCSYQSIMLTIEYCEFKTVMDFKLIDTYDYLPAISLCVDSVNKGTRFDHKNSDSTDNKTFGPMRCTLFSPLEGRSIWNDCDKFSDIFESFTNYGKKCLTFFSSPFGLKRFIDKAFIPTLILYEPIDLMVLIHQNITPPHLNRNMMRIDRNFRTSVGYSSISEESLPYPYETNCFEYQKSLRKGIFYSSREDCIVKHYQRKEFEKCGCNRKWIYYNKENSTGVKLCSKSSKCNFEYKFDESLVVMCRKNCYNKYYNTYEDGKIRSTDGIQYIVFLKHMNEEISITHSAKMNFNDYLSSIGGLMSM